MPSLSYHFIEDHRENNYRSGEGAAVELSDGRFLVMYTAFRGESSADHAPAEIHARVSSDEGASWTESTAVFLPPAGALNVMAVSLLRLADGRIGCTYSIKWTETHCTPQWTTSSDEGTSWTQSQPITTEQEYFTVNNDRLVQLRDGTLLLPYALIRGITPNANDKELLKEWLNAWCGIFYSPDGGQTWHRPDTARRFQKEWFALPEPFALETMASIEQQAVREKYDVFQEPGVVELADGRLMLWIRSLCHVYCAISEGKNAPWTGHTAVPGINAPCSPQTIKRLPATGDLIMVYNDREETPFGSPTFQIRSPLSLAVSHDEGRTWVKIAPLEKDQSRSYCYFSLLFFGEKFLLTYYESTLVKNPDGSIRLTSDGSPARRNLASLKMCCGDQSRLTTRGVTG